MLSCGLRMRILFSLLCSLPLIILIMYMMAHGEVHPIPRAYLHHIQPFHLVRISMFQGAAVSRLLLCIALPRLALWVQHVKVPYAWSFLQPLMAALHLVAALLQVVHQYVWAHGWNQFKHEHRFDSFCQPLLSAATYPFML